MLGMFFVNEEGIENPVAVVERNGGGRMVLFSDDRMWANEIFYNIEL